MSTRARPAGLVRLAALVLLGGLACRSGAGHSIDPCAAVPAPCPALSTCQSQRGAATCVLLPEPVEASQATFDALTTGIDQPLSLPDRAEETVGTLVLGLHPHLTPIVLHPSGALVAASTLGEGRVVAFSGQDFLSSGDRSTLVDDPGGARLLANAVTWARHGATGRVLVDNEAVRAALEGQGVTSVDVVTRDGEVRDWSIDLAPYAAVAIQVNEWGTARLTAAAVAHLRAFVQSGGGLLVAGSALHWRWWLTSVAPEFPGDALLDGAGIRWNVDSLLDLAGSEMAYDAQSSPLALWYAYSSGAPVGDDKYPRLASLFGSAARGGLDLDPALRRLIGETPALPVSSSLPRAVLAADIVSAMPPHRWPSPHPWAAVFPGAVPAGAVRVKRHRVSVDRRWVGPAPLGLYAPPGEVVVVRVASGALPRDVSIQVGELHDELTTIPEIETWQRAPLTYRTFDLDATEVAVGSPIGGTLYAVLPDAGLATGALELEVTGAVQQPLYVDGQTIDWTAARSHPAPQAILELPGKVRLSVDARAIRNEDDPAGIMAYWGGFHDSHVALSQEPVLRRRASHMIFDIQVGWGYANATTSRINHPKAAEAWALRRDLATEDIWLFAHEMGHQFQTSSWTGGDLTEVCVNLFTMYTLNRYRNGGGDRETRGHQDNTIDHVALKRLRWPTADFFQKLELYRQLVFEFGWSRYQQVFASYYAPTFSDTLDGTHLDGFAIRFSRVVGRDLTRFFDNWQYPLSARARARIAGFGLPPWLPPGW